VQPWASCLHTSASVTKQYNLVPANRPGWGRGWPYDCDWESDRRSGVALATRQTLVILHLGAQGLGEGDELPPTLSCGVW